MFLAIGTFVWCRVRRRHQRFPADQTEEENIPLNTNHRFQDEGEDEEDQGTYRQRKGKERAREPPQAPIFDVGNSDDEDDQLPRKRDTQDV